jgi:hypothetical protein
MKLSIHEGTPPGKSKTQNLHVFQSASGRPPEHAVFASHDNFASYDNGMERKFDREKEHSSGVGQRIDDAVDDLLH